MAPLSEALGISVNELLTGERIPAEEYQEEIPAGEQEDMGTAIPGPEEMQEPPESGFDEGPGQTDESEAEA